MGELHEQRPRGTEVYGVLWEKGVGHLALESRMSRIRGKVDLSQLASRPQTLKCYTRQTFYFVAGYF